MRKNADAAGSSVTGQTPDESVLPGRLSALEIFTAAAQTGEDELKRSSTGLAVSGFAAGFGMGLTGLGTAVITQATGGEGPASQLLAALLYPLGFVVVVLGRAQLFTENTVFPVILVLDRGRHLLNMLRLWAVVFAANVVGTLLFAVFVTQAPVLSPPVTHTLAELGAHSALGGFGHIFWSGVAGGWIIALMAWLVTASRFTLGQLALVYLLTFAVGAAGLAHCIAGSAEALSAVMAGLISPADYLWWLLAATVGNVVGGVFIVSVLNYGQVVGSGQDVAKARQRLEDIDKRSGAR
jgi:formate/nitrite transporter FocA (FNT family)